MAKNVGESRIPVPRAARPSFFPKSRPVGSTKIPTGHRRSLVLSGCLQFVDAEPGTATPAQKCLGRGTTSTPLTAGSRPVKSAENTFTVSSPIWDLDKNDVQQLVHFGEETNRFFSLFENTQLPRIEDIADNCLVDVTSSSYNESAAGSTPHYLMLNKQNSFEYDESLGILTPDQMTDFTVALECSRTPSCENLTGSAGSRLALTRATASRPSGDGEPTEEVSSERTPSPEELPLDPKPVEPARGGGASVPVSFITSVTSITSLEAGYQGDGENSRPASRGADPPSVAPPPNLPVPCRQDPMTDSDFFTESDADAHEEIVRGDRKAQVIDGTLFCAPGGRRCPSFTGEEMDSSGIYSDLDKRQDEQNAPEEQQEESDRTPDTVDTEVSQRSQPSPFKKEVTHVILDYLEVSADPLNNSTNSSDPISPAQITVIKLERSNESSGGRSNTSSKSDSLPFLKKYKMPKRNVASKIKAMIESGPKDEAEKEARLMLRPLDRMEQRPTRKCGRWDAVMSKIEAGKSEQRTRPGRKEVKSKVLQSLAQSSSSMSTLKKAGDANNNNNKDKRSRCRQKTKSPTQETARSSVRSSMSDLSSAPGKDVLKRSPTSGTPPRRLATNGRVVQQERINSFDAKKNCVDVTVNLEKSPSATRKPVITRRLTANVPGKQQTATQPTKDREANKKNNNGYVVTARSSPETRDQSAQTEAPYEALRVKRAERMVQALSVTVQYLAYQLDAFSTPKLREDCERMKNDWLAACTEIDQLRVRHLDIEERLNAEREDHKRALDQLREELEARYAEQVSVLESALLDERRTCEIRLRDSVNEAIREQRTAVARVRSEHEAELARRDAETKRRSVVHDQGAALTAEVESLRSVLELRSQENAMMRAELDSFRREAEEKETLQQRVDTLEARCEDLRAQVHCKESFERQISHENEVLHESLHQVSKHNKRLAQRNEELQWRLRQKNEVVTVLANQLATPPRLSRYPGTEHQSSHTSPSDKSSSQSSSMVKFMVEKGDSVSWTLEIDESSKGASADAALGTPSKLVRPEGVTTVSRQGSLRLSSRRPSLDMRARSKSISVTDSTRVEDAVWAPMSSSTPNTRRRPRSHPSSSSSSSSSSSASSSGAATNPVVAVAVAAAAAAAAAAEDSNAGQRPQEAGGEAMISEETSASSSEDESSTSSDVPRVAMQFAWGKPIK